MLNLLFARHSLVTRIVWLTVSALVISALMIAFWTRVAVIEDATDKGIEQVEAMNLQVLKRLESELSARKERLQRLARQAYDPINHPLMPKKELQHTLDSKIWLHDAFNGGLMIVSQNGRIAVDSPIYPNRVGIDLSDRTHFHQVRDTGKPYISDVLTGRAVKKPVYITAAPILGAEGRFIGMVAGVTILASDTLLQEVAETTLPEQSDVYIIDLSHELIITSSRPEMRVKPLSSLSNSGVIDQILEGKTSGIAHSHFGGNVIYSSRTIKDTSWVIVNTYSLDRWIGYADTLTQNILLLTILITAIITGFVIIYLRRILLPIQTTTALISRMSQPGLKAHPIEAHYDDELGTLISAFNRLIEHLNKNKAELQKAQQKSEDANQAKSQFLANVSHELKTPLNAILSLTHIQLEHTFDYDSRLRLQKVQRSGRALLGLVNDVFSYIALENKNEISQIEPFHLEETLSDLVQDYTDLDTEKPLELFFWIAPDIPLQLCGDNRHLLQVLDNLLGNAVKFTAKGHAGIRVTPAKTVSTSNDQISLLFEVTDTGQGISQDELSKLFTAFQQLDNTDNRAFGGMGMGLAISYKLIQLMGGSGIDVDSEPNKGSTFSFTLTFRRDQNALTSSGQDQLTCSLAVRKALIIDDQPVSREMLREILEQCSVMTDTAPTLQEGLRLLNEPDNHYGVVFVDWNMPESTGGAVISQLDRVLETKLTTEGHPAPLVFLLASAGDIEVISDQGITSHHLIPKPFSQTQICQAINDAFYGQRHNKSQRPRAKDARVLVVDDNKVNREVVAALLSRYQIDSDLVENGRNAVNNARQNRYDLIFMDLQMPVLNGYEATQEIRSFDKEIPIIALTAASREDDRQRCFDSGMNGFLTKPIEQKVFYHEVGLYIDITAQAHDKKTTVAPQAREKQDKQRILIVDDEMANLKILANTLSKRYTVQLATNGARAIELSTGNNQPDLILLDIQMPGMDGYDVCKQLKDNPVSSKIPVIFVTALTESESEQKGLSLGAVDYITKPYKMPVVQARVRTHINLKRKTDLLEALSYLDGLTHIANRRHFDIMLGNELNRLQRGHQHLGLIMLDIDYFKPFNDNYGHGKGDECLQLVAKALHNEVERPSDLVARYGGEEFVVILPECDAEGVTQVAEKLRAAVERLNYPHEFSKVTDHVTISAGCLSQKIKRDTTAGEILKRTDNALYEAKKQGRNCVVLATQHSEFARI